MKPNIVVGAVRGYSFEQLRPFILSLRNTSFNGEVVFLWNQLSEETLNCLRNNGVRLLHFDYRGQGGLNSWSRFWPVIKVLVGLPVGYRVRREIYKRICNLALVRYIHILDFLEKESSEYENILITDVRDVIFQDDPFRDALSFNVCAFLEAPHMRFGCEEMNTAWMQANYGADTLIGLTGQRLSCCGTVVGSAAQMLIYLRQFFNELAKLRSIEHGADTSIHNVLIRNVMPGMVDIVDNFAGAVATIGSNDLSSLVVRQDGIVMGTNDRAVPVLHQYDRHPCLAADLIAKLAPSDP
jgi:hypothetical protein